MCLQWAAKQITLLSISIFDCIGSVVGATQIQTYADDTEEYGIWIQYWIWPMTARRDYLPECGWTLKTNGQTCRYELSVSWWCGSRNSAASSRIAQFGARITIHRRNISNKMNLSWSISLRIFDISQFAVEFRYSHSSCCSPIVEMRVSNVYER